MPPAPPSDTATDTDPIAATRRWLERAVIGLNLCPFAKAVHAKDQVRYVLSAATAPDALLEQLAAELLLLRETPAAQVDTTLLVHPDVIVERNLATLQRLGEEGYRRLLQDD